MTNKSNTQKTYTEEFKRDAVRLAGERGNTAAVARDLGISSLHGHLRGKCLCRWRCLCRNSNVLVQVAGRVLVMNSDINAGGRKMNDKSDWEHIIRFFTCLLAGCFIGLAIPLACLYACEIAAIHFYNSTGLMKPIYVLIIVACGSIPVLVYPLIEMIRDRYFVRNRSISVMRRDAVALRVGGLAVLLGCAGYTSFPFTVWCDRHFGFWYVAIHVRLVLVIAGLLLMAVAAALQFRRVDA